MNTANKDTLFCVGCTVRFKNHQNRTEPYVVEWILDDNADPGKCTACVTLRTGAVRTWATLDHLERC